MYEDDSVAIRIASNLIGKLASFDRDAT